MYSKKVVPPLVLIILTCLSISGIAAAESYTFSLGPTFGDSDVFNFTVTSPGAINAEATWHGSASGLALILNGPGQVGYFARENGNSPLTLRYTATNADISHGDVWRISIVNFGGGYANGTLTLTWDLTGVWKCDDGGRYYIRQMGNQVVWYGEQNPCNPAWANVMYGTLIGDILQANWADVPKGDNINHGALVLQVESSDKIKVVTGTGGFEGSSWSKLT